MDWTTARWLTLFAALGFALVGTQVSLFHYRGNFRNPTMWAPVIAAPLLVRAGVALLGDGFAEKRPEWQDEGSLRSSRASPPSSGRS